MKLLKIFYIILFGTLLVACNKDENKDDGGKAPIENLQLPPASTPLKSGESIVIQGKGFSETSEIWLKGSTGSSIQATVTSVTESGITFTAPKSVSGSNDVILKQDGKEYLLGKLTFEITNPDAITYKPILFSKADVEWIDETAEDYHATKADIINELKDNNKVPVSLAEYEAYYSYNTENGKTTTFIYIIYPEVISTEDVLCTILNKATWKSSDFSSEIRGNSELNQLPLAVKISDKWYVTTTELEIHKCPYLGLTVIDIEIEK